MLCSPSYLKNGEDDTHLSIGNTCKGCCSHDVLVFSFHASQRNAIYYTDFEKQDSFNSKPDSSRKMNAVGIHQLNSDRQIIKSKHEEALRR